MSRTRLLVVAYSEQLLPRAFLLFCIDTFWQMYRNDRCYFPSYTPSFAMHSSTYYYSIKEVRRLYIIGTARLLIVENRRDCVSPQRRNVLSS